MDVRTGIRRLITLFITLFFALSAGLVYWQVVVANQVTANPHNIRHCLADSAPIRGRIFDRNGVLLADSQQLGPCGYMRHYYDASLAGLIGYYISPSYPSTGIEAQFNDYLTGKIGLTSVDNIVNQTLHQPPIGDDIYLTIDERIQKLVNQHFDDPIPIDNVNTFQTNRGSVIVSNPHTGEILAVVSRPNYDPNKLVQTLAHGDLSYFNQLNTNADQPLLFRPLRGLYAPGSTYKTLTLIAGLDSGSVTLNTPFTQQQALGPIVINGQPFGPIGNNIQDYTFRFPVTTEYGYTHSDNIIFAQVGDKTGAGRWLDYNNRFYVGQKIPFDLTTAVSTVLKSGQTTLSPNELAADAFGQGYDFVTPMQMTLIDNAVANDGQLMRPMIVQKIVDRNATPILTNTPQALGSPQMSTQTATLVRQAMYGVINCGSGLLVRDLFSSQSGIVGKTGTAEIGNGKPANSWLITQAPYTVVNPSQAPGLTIVGMKENGGEGGVAVGPMLAHMYNDIFATVMKNVQLPAAPDPLYCCNTQLLQRGCP